MQTIDKTLFDELEEEIRGGSNPQNTITTSTIPYSTKLSTQTEWMQKICAKVKISDLADEFGVTSCPNHAKSYPIDFDDSRGFFICIKAKYDNICDFKGNIVDFVRRCKR